MDIKKTLILDGSEPVSKAAAQLMDCTAVIITKSGKYCGIIDHGCINQGVRDPSSVKCENLVAKPPVLSESSDIMERVDAFMMGHFKALPVVDEKDSPIGITTRVELLDDIHKGNLAPKGSVNDLMGTPAFSIDENETIGKTRTMMKEKDVRRLIVTKQGYPLGVVSIFDIGAWVTKPDPAGGRKDKSGFKEDMKVDDLKISQFIRPDVATVENNSSIDDAINRMIQKQVSAVVVLSNKKPVGVLSALDIFKIIKENAEAKDVVSISGLNDDTIIYYDTIKQKLNHVLGKFGQSFNITAVSVHVKEEKSTYVINLAVEMTGGRITLKLERESIKEAVDELASELDQVLRKRKDQRIQKPRRYASGRREV